VYTSIVEFASVVLFIGCAWHAVRYAGRGFAQQWFIAGYLFGLIRENIVQIAFPIYLYAPALLRVGAAPAFVSLLWACVSYLAYQFARRFTASKNYGPVAALMFLVAASLTLPIEATAAQLRWWVYQEPARVVFGGVPVSMPLVWGGAAAIYYAIFNRVRMSKLPERGRVYAMITLSPVIAAAHLVYALILGAMVG
jgi:hypothetical protein